MKKTCFRIGVVALVIGIAASAFIGIRDARAQKKVVIGFSFASFMQERWLREKDRFVDKAKSLGATVLVDFANDNATIQEAQAEKLIDKSKVDVLVVQAHDGEKAAAIVEKAHKAGIKVIAYDRMIKGDLDYYISFDNVKVGEFEARGVLDAVDKGNFAYIGGSPTDNNAFLVKEGSMKVLKPYIDRGDIKLVYEKFTENWDPQIALQHAEEALRANNNDIQAFVCANDGTAGGVVQALAEVGLAGKVPTSGQDAELSACRRIVEGTQASTVYNPGKKIAEKAAEVAVSFAKGQRPSSNSKVNNGKIDVVSFLLEPIMVTAGNMVDTVIADGWQSYDDVYISVPVRDRPPKP